MLHGFIHSFQDSLMITIFVISMMIILEFINVISRGKWLKKLQQLKIGQSVIGSMLGALPGCLGVYSVVTMYAHRVLKLGAVVAAMLATSGDEAFVMFAMFPKTALFLTVILLVIGIVVGFVTERFIVPGRESMDHCSVGFSLHDEQNPFSLSPRRMWTQLRSGNVIRPLLLLVMLGFILLLATAKIGHGFGWEQFTLIGVGIVTVTLILAADEHFLMDHLWKHVILKHVVKIFSWVFATMVVIVLIRHMQLDTWISRSPLALLLFAAVLGIIPQSGPHLLFVNLFAQGLAPFSVLLTSSIVQDGHGSLPLLAHSRKDFIIVKAINLVTGLALGLLVYAIGY